MLASVSDIDLAGLRFFRFATGKLGYVCYVNAEDAHSAWDAIMAAGQPHGILPYGMDTLDAASEHNPYECRVFNFIRCDCGNFGLQALL